MNFHTDKWIMQKLEDHYKEALEYFPEERIVGIFCQGSQNYNIDTKNSDVDTKLIVLPSFDDIIFNKSAISTTHIRKNNEHIDFKDIRLMFQTFRKQNLNFLEILFTKYKIVNPMYKELWNRLVAENEKVARYNEYAAVKAMKGIALEKYHALEKLYPSKVSIIEKYGYDNKQLHHLARVKEYLDRYMAGEKYADCLISNKADYLIELKTTFMPLEDARKLADQLRDEIVATADAFCADNPSNPNPKVDELLDTIQGNIIRKYLTYMLIKGE